MNTNIILIVVAFLAAAYEEFRGSNENDKPTKWKFVRSSRITLIFLGVVLLLQIADTISVSLEKRRQNTLSSQTYSETIKTQNKLGEVNHIVDSSLNIILEQVKQLDGLNTEIDSVKQNLNESLVEYSKLNEKYQRQYEIEILKIDENRPIITSYMPKLFSDSSSISLQFNIRNYGNRMADSVKYIALVIFADSLMLFPKIQLLRTNIFEGNILKSQPSAKNNETKVIDGGDFLRSDIEETKKIYLLIRYWYYDFMTQKKYTSDLEIYKEDNFFNSNTQLGTNVGIKELETIKRRIRIEDLVAYEYLFENRKP